METIQTKRKFAAAIILTTAVLGEALTSSYVFTCLLCTAIGWFYALHQAKKSKSVFIDTYMMVLPMMVCAFYYIIYFAWIIFLAMFILK